MAYDVLDDSLYDESPKKKGKKASRNKFLRLNPLYIHIIIILIIMLLIFFYFVKDFSFSEKDSLKPDLILIGNMENFSVMYSGDIKMESSKFTIVADSGSFEERKRDILIKDFSGRIYESNKSIILDGTATEIEFGRNKILIGGNNFILESDGKVKMNLFYDSIAFEFVSGKAKLGTLFTYDLSGSIVEIDMFNFSIAYDGAYSISGKTDTFSIYSPELGINILYEYPGTSSSKNISVS